MNVNNMTAEAARNRGSLSTTGDGGLLDSWEGVVRELVSTLRFGVVQITVYESHVVQVERTEKVRFAPPASQKPNR